MPNFAWMTTTEAHEYTGIPRRTIIAAVNRGDLEARKLPGQTGAFLLSRASVDAWADRRRTRSPRRAAG